MANLKDIVATLAILSAGTLTLTGCKKTEGESTTPDGGTEVTPADGGGETETETETETEDADASEEDSEAASCSSGDDEAASCSGAA